MLQSAARRALLRNNATSRLISRNFAAGKEISFGVEGRAAMLKGVDLLADAVQVCISYETIIHLLNLDIIGNSRTKGQERNNSPTIRSTKNNKGRCNSRKIDRFIRSSREHGSTINQSRSIKNQ